MHIPKKRHFVAVYKILRYLKGTPVIGLFFKKRNQRIIEIYTNADWASSSIDSKSTLRYCTYFRLLVLLQFTSSSSNKTCGSGFSFHQGKN